MKQPMLPKGTLCGVHFVRPIQILRILKRKRVEDSSRDSRAGAGCGGHPLWLGWKAER
jgi:hypothetical protein